MPTANSSGVRLWIDGRVVADPTTPVVTAIDHGLTVGDGVFETLAVIDGTPFALTRHLERLGVSARGLGLPAPDLSGVRAGIDAVLAGWEAARGRLRITYTAGASPLGSDRGTGTPTLVVAVTDLPVRPATTAVSVVPWTRNEHGALTGLKTTSYAENVRALACAHERGSTEAIFANTAGNLCEGTGSNIFLVLDGRLVTPPTSAGCLAGVTRALVLEWVGAEERDVPMAALSRAEEVFLTSTTREVQAVASIDGHERIAPGPVTAKAMAIFGERAAAQLDP